MNDRDRFAPVSLAGEDPVAQLVIDLCLTDALFGEEFDHLGLCVLHAQTVNEAGIDKNTCLAVGKGFLLDVLAALDNYPHRE